MHRRQFLGSVLSSPMIAAGWKLGPPPLLESEILQMMGVAPVPGAVMGVLTRLVLLVEREAAMQGELITVKPRGNRCPGFGAQNLLNGDLYFGAGYPGDG